MDQDGTDVAESRTMTLAGRQAVAPMKAADIIAHVKLVEEIKQAVMKDGTHYGTIPGCPKPSLYKPGAEMLLMAFRLCSDHEVEIRELGDGHREYTTRTYIKTAGGLLLAVGIGLCSTMESKYRYRFEQRKCPSCGKEAIIKGKEEFGGGWICFKKKGGCGEKFDDGDDAIESQSGGKVENPDLADVYHTVLQMSKKRSLVCGARTATACSDFFAQDLEDLKAQADRAEQEENGNVEVWMRKIAACATPEALKATRADAFAWIADPVKRNRLTAACTKRAEELVPEGHHNDQPTGPKRKPTLRDVVVGSGAKAPATPTGSATQHANQPDAAPVDQADSAPMDRQDDEDAVNAEFARLMERLRGAEATLAPDVVEAAYQEAGVSAAIEDYASLPMDGMRRLVEMVEKARDHKPAAKPAAKTAAAPKPTTISFEDQIRYVARARMDKPVEFTKTLARVGVSTATKPSEMTEAVRMQVIRDAFGLALPVLK